MRFRPPTLHSGWSSSAQTAQLPDATSTSAIREKCRTWSCCRWYSAQFITKIQGTMESSLKCCVPHATQTQLDASECPLRNVNTRSPQLFQNLCCVAARISVTWHDSSGLSAIMRPWRCDCFIASPPMTDSTVRQHFPVLCPFSASDCCFPAASSCECPRHTALVPMSTTILSLSILQVGSVPFRMPRGA